jgi:general secretion pathway protein F
MPLFAYKALDKGGNTIKGSLPAHSVKEARSILRSQDLLVTEISSEARSLARKRISQDILIDFSRQLSQMLKAGMPLYESLSSLEENYRTTPLHPILLHICDAVKEGDPLSKALEYYPCIFDTLFCSLIRAGETTGSLAKAFAKVSELLSHNNTMKKQLTTMLLYPALLMTLSFFVIIALVVFVVPALEDLFDPKTTTGLTYLVIAISRFLREYFLFYIPLSILAVGATLWKLRTPQGMLLYDKWILRVPLVKKFVQQTSLARFTRSLASLLTEEIPLVDALHLAEKTITNTVIKTALNTATRRVIEGGSLSQELQKTKCFPQHLLTMIYLGEKSSSLAEMLTTTADMYDEEITKTRTRIITLAQPVILITMGAVIGILLLSIVGPLTDINALSLR